MADHNTDPTRRVTPGPEGRHDTHAPQPRDVADDQQTLRGEEDVLYETHHHHDGDVHGPSVHRRGESADADIDLDTAQDERPERLGDILGLSDAPPDVQIPKPEDPGSGNAPGLEVRSPVSGTGELSRSKGATGIDMGSSGSGTDVDPTGTRRGSGA